MQQSQQFAMDHMAHLDDKSDDNIVIFQTYTLTNRYRYPATYGESYLARDYTPIYARLQGPHKNRINIRATGPANYIQGNIAIGT